MKNELQQAKHCASKSARQINHSDEDSKKSSRPIKSLAAEGRAGCALPSRKRASAGITARIMAIAREERLRQFKAFCTI